MSWGSNQKRIIFVGQFVEPKIRFARSLKRIEGINSNWLIDVPLEEI